MLEERFTPVGHEQHQRQVWELRLLDQRIRIVSRSILLCTGSAALICAVVAGLFLAQLVGMGYARAIALAFAVAMVMLIGGLIMFLWEVQLALRTVAVPARLLERDGETRL